MKKVYEAPKAEALEVKANDIITTSGDGINLQSLDGADTGNGVDVGNN